ncbi:MAG: GNAT family N-acetyltransferase [Bacillus sp. (in: firmicutes)]
MDLQIKQLHTVEELQEMRMVESMIWGEDVIPVHQTLTVAKNGGIILGGYIEGKLVGILYSFPGIKNGKLHLCSHMLGFLPEYRSKGYGKLMKEKQKQLAVEQGYQLITWTFDPMESANAYLNIGKLHGICRTYIENCYGDSDDLLSSGLPTDRFLVERYITSEHAQERSTYAYETRQYAANVLQNEAGYPYVHSFNKALLDDLQNVEVVAVTVPTQFQQMKKDDFPLAKEWRWKTRELFTKLFAESFVIVDVVRTDSKVSQEYILVKQDNVNIQFN